MQESEFVALKRKVLDAWDAISGFAASVPNAAETKRLLALAGCPTEASDLGLGAQETVLGLSGAHYLRDRFTVKKLTLMLGLG